MSAKPVIRFVAAAIVALAASVFNLAAAEESLETTINPSEAAASAPAPTTLPHYPRPGDKLGYSREESIRRLDDGSRRLLDGVLRVYREPGLFGNRAHALVALGVRSTLRRFFKIYFNDGILHDRFVDDFAITDSPLQNWTGIYAYEPRSIDPNMWHASLDINKQKDALCIDSRAVEGYLDLFLYPALDGYVTPLPPRLWDRHGSFGRPYAKALRPDTPALQLVFSSGCLISIQFANSFSRSDLNDDHVY